MPDPSPRPTPPVSLLLLREVAQELGYHPPAEQLPPINQQILDRLFELPPRVLASSELSRRYRTIAARVLRQHARQLRRSGSAGRVGFTPPHAPHHPPVR